MKIHVNASILTLLKTGHRITTLTATLRSSSLTPRQIVVDHTYHPSRRFPFNKKGLEEALYYMQHPKGEL